MSWTKSFSWRTNNGIKQFNPSPLYTGKGLMIYRITAADSVYHHDRPTTAIARQGYPTFQPERYSLVM